MKMLFLALMLSLPAQLACSHAPLLFRGGIALKPPPSVRSAMYPQSRALPLEECAVVVAVSAGSRYLDRRKLLRVGHNATIADLKASLTKVFPGYPPASLLRLSLQGRALSDMEDVGNLTELSPIPLSLDLLTGTGIYNRSVLSVSDALEMLAALEVHSAENAALQVDILRGRFAALNQSSLKFDELFKEHNSSLYEAHSQGIQRALIAEMNPEKDSLDTVAWKELPLKQAHKWRASSALNMNYEEMKTAITTSALLTMYALWVSSSAASECLLLTGVLLYWFSRLRWLRYHMKVLLYFLLPQLAEYDFALPMLSTPYQSIAKYFNRYLNGGLGDKTGHLFGVSKPSRIFKYAESITVPLYRSASSILSSTVDDADGWLQQNTRLSFEKIPAPSGRSQIKGKKKRSHSLG